MSVSICRSFPANAVSAVEGFVTAALVISLLATTLLAASGGPAHAEETHTRVIVAENLVGVVQRYSVTLKLKDGTTKTFVVKGNINLGYVDDGDEVRVTIEKNKITSISLAYPENDRR
jgi:hypothetical protein